MSTTQASRRNAAITTQALSATPQDKRPAPAKIGPEAAFGAAVQHRAALGAGGMLALQAAAGNRAVAGLVQAKRARSSAEDSVRVHEAAKLGIGGDSGKLPYLETIQRSFGRHDVTGVVAHTGAQATAGAQAMGAAAFATGNHVAFAGSADLRTAAHEAAHVVQQRAGVQFAEGVGQVGDRHERHADAVAEAVMQGRSAEGMIDRQAPAGAARGASAPVQRRIKLDDELLETHVAPQPAWGFSAGEKTVYNIINDAAHPVITFTSVDQLQAFVRQVAPFLEFYRRELGHLPSPVASNQVIADLANRSEEIRGGHSLERHGPQIGFPQLRDRLTTGFVNGEFAPAGALGFATGFTSHEAFLTSQQAALVHIQAAYTATSDGLRPLVATLKAQIRGLDGLAGAPMGSQKKAIILARKAISDFVTNNRLNNPATAPLNMLPLGINAGIFNTIHRLAHDEDGQVDRLLEFFDRYRIVLANPAQVGRGLRVRHTEIDNPKGHVRNPAFPVAGVQEPIFHSHQLQSMGEIQNTATTVNPPHTTFAFGLDVANWTVPQHFPDNGAPGWRG